jgi:hypothetical protein
VRKRLIAAAEIHIAGIREIIIDYLLTNRKHINIICNIYRYHHLLTPIGTLVDIIDDKQCAWCEPWLRDKFMVVLDII